MATARFGTGWGGCSAEEVSSRVFIAPAAEDVSENNSPTELIDRLGCCQVIREDSSEGGAQPPCELFVSLDAAGQGVPVAALELVSNSGICELSVQADGEAEPSYLATIRGQKLDMDPIRTHQDPDLPGLQLLRTNLVVEPPVVWRSLRLRLLSLRGGDKGTLGLVSLSISRASSAICRPSDTDEQHGHTGGQPGGIHSLSTTGGSASQSRSAAMSSQMGDVRSYLDSILGPGASAATKAGQHGGGQGGDQNKAQCTMGQMAHHAGPGAASLGASPAGGILGALAKAALMSRAEPTKETAAVPGASSSSSSLGTRDAAPGVSASDDGPRSLGGGVAAARDMVDVKDRLERIEQSCARLEEGMAAAMRGNDGAAPATAGSSRAGAASAGEGDDRGGGADERDFCSREDPMSCRPSSDTKAAARGAHRPDAATVARIEKRLGNLEATTAAVERKLDRVLEQLALLNNR